MFKHIDKEMRRNDYENLRPYQKFPEEKSNAGSTGIVLLLTPGKFLIANLGDSRVLKFSKDNSILTHDFGHKPDNPSELKRIQEAGGKVVRGRINGKLNLCRAFGDYQFKRKMDLP